MDGNGVPLPKRISPSDGGGPYTTGRIITFTIQEAGMVAIKDSIRISGTLVTRKANGAPLDPGANVFWDGFIGAQGLFQQITTKCTNSRNTFGELENIQDYPRYQRMKAQGGNFQYGNANARNARELRVGPSALSNSVALGLITNATGTGGNSTSEGKNYFTMRPDFCLNNMTSDIAFDVTGRIEIRFTVAPNFLFGTDVNTIPAVYYLEDVCLTYKVRPATNKDVEMGRQLTFQTYSTVPVTCRTNFTVNMTSSDAVFAYVTGFYPRYKDLVSGVNCYSEPRTWPGISNVEISLSGEQMFFSYTLTSLEQILHEGLKALNGGAYRESGFIYPLQPGEVGFVSGYFFGELLDIQTERTLMIKYTSEDQSGRANNYESLTFVLVSRTLGSGSGQPVVAT